MSDLALVFKFVTDTVSDYVLMLNSFWLTQIVLYIIVLSIVVSTIILLRGR